MIVHLAATWHIAEDSNSMFKGNKSTLGIPETAILQPKSLDLDKCPAFGFCQLLMLFY